MTLSTDEIFIHIRSKHKVYINQSFCALQKRWIGKGITESDLTVYLNIFVCTPNQSILTRTGHYTTDYGLCSTKHAL